MRSMAARPCDAPWSAAAPEIIAITRTSTGRPLIYSPR
jgi:hypothetical protein